MNNNKTNVIIRTSEEEKELFKQYAKERGITVTAYVKEKCLGEDRGSIYNKEVQDTLEMISDIYITKLKTTVMMNHLKRSVRKELKDYGIV